MNKHRAATGSAAAPYKIVGHRGARGLAPENTIASIRKALEHRVDEVEIDVRVTNDGVVVLHHDLHLHDQAGNSYNLHHTPHKKLLAHKPDLTTLGAAIEYIGRTVPLQIEVKRGERVGPIVKVVQSYLDNGWQASDFLFGSKSQQTLEALHRAIPEIPVVVIEPSSSIIAHWRLWRLKPDAVRLSMGQRWMWSGFIRAIGHTRYQLYVYTLDDTAKAKHWARLGMAGVITDRPDLYDQQNSKTSGTKVKRPAAKAAK